MERQPDVRPELANAIRTELSYGLTLRMRHGLVRLESKMQQFQENHHEQISISHIIKGKFRRSLSVEVELLAWTPSSSKPERPDQHLRQLATRTHDTTEKYCHNLQSTTAAMPVPARRWISEGEAPGRDGYILPCHPSWRTCGSGWEEKFYRLTSYRDRHIIRIRKHSFNI
jgi:hypothetical protein